MYKVKKYLEVYEGTPRGRASSVRYSLNNKRFKRAEDEAEKNVVKIEEIKKYCIEIQEMLGFSKPICMYIDVKDVNYEQIKERYRLKNVRDILWIKFTKDNYVGVVAKSNDINFARPEKAEDYKIREGNAWKFNTSGIIIHHLNKYWNTKQVLIIPLTDIPLGLESGDVERALGNYLIDKGVPILDFYSHNY